MLHYSFQTISHTKLSHFPLTKKLPRAIDTIHTPSLLSQDKTSTITNTDQTPLTQPPDRTPYFQALFTCLPNDTTRFTTQSTSTSHTYRGHQRQRLRFTTPALRQNRFKHFSSTTCHHNLSQPSSFNITTSTTTTTYTTTTTTSTENTTDTGTTANFFQDITIH